MASDDQADIRATLSRIQAAKREHATEFALEDAEISRETLAEVATISSLQSLSLRLDFFKAVEEQTLPKITDISAISSLTSLTTLDISHFKHLMDLTPIESLTKLKDLKLYYCPALDDLGPLSGCTSLESLDLSLCYKIADLTPLAGLSSLRSIQAPYCTKLKDLLPLAGLISLEKLLLYGSENLFDLSSLSNLISLKHLDLEDCTGLRQFAPLVPLLATLESLILHGCTFEDIPVEIYGAKKNENVIAGVRAYYADLANGHAEDTEIRALLLGNGSAGKTQLSRRLRNLDFDRTIPTTHGIKLESTTIALEESQGPIRLNLWDFGGQEVYHGTHSLFVQGRAIFLVLWTPELEAVRFYMENGVAMSHRPLPYWLDYLRAFAGTDNPVILVQSKCDTKALRIREVPCGEAGDFTFLLFEQVSAATGYGLDELHIALKKAVREALDRRPPLPIGIGRARVRDRLRDLLSDSAEQHRTIDRAFFDQICDDSGGISDRDAFLDFLHYSGVVFYRPGIFEGRIILDQNWALEAIYTLFDRTRVLPLLRGYGRFTRADLELLVWSGYSREEQEIFLGMMEGCGICFKTRQLDDKEWEYIAPELLPDWSEAKRSILAAPLEALIPAAELEVAYAFLHEGILRNYLSRIGRYAADAAVYWRYGFTFYEENTGCTVLLQSDWGGAETGVGPGKLRLRAWGGNGMQLLSTLVEELKRLPFGQQPEIQWKSGGSTMPPGKEPEVVARPIQEAPVRLSIPPSPHPTVGSSQAYISYAWGDNSSPLAMQREKLVDGVCTAAESKGWKIVRDKDAMQRGDRISDFMRMLSAGDLIIVVISDKYLHSPYCMQELVGIFRRASSDSKAFQRHIIPLIFDDANIGAWRYRVEIAKHWSAEYKAMEDVNEHLGVEDRTLCWKMKDWHNTVGDVLAYVSDVLAPHGFDAIAKDDYATLHDMLAKSIREA